MQFRNFVNSIGANFVDFYKAIEMGNVPGYFAWMCAGFFDTDFDHIAINESVLGLMGCTLEEVTLHELIHWTGYKARLNRECMNNPKKFNRDMEECIAQIGMYKLACILNLDESIYRKKRDRYLLKFKTDLVEAERQADIAVNYLMEIANSSQQAA